MEGNKGKQSVCLFRAFKKQSLAPGDAISVIREARHTDPRMFIEVASNILNTQHDE